MRRICWHKCMANGAIACGQLSGERYAQLQSVRIRDNISGSSTQRSGSSAASVTRLCPQPWCRCYSNTPGTDSLLILKAEAQRELVAGMLFLRHGRSATYHIGWSNAQGKRGGAHNLLMWQAMLRLKAAGVRWLDLGGIATDHGVGLARFKLGTGATVSRLCGTYF